VVLLHGALLLGRGLPAELAVHFRMSAAALTRTLGEDLQWTVPAHVRHEQGAEADLLVLADHPDGPAGQGTPCSFGWGGGGSVGEEGVEPSRPYGHTDLHRARLPFRHSPWRKRR